MIFVIFLSDSITEISLRNFYQLLGAPKREDILVTAYSPTGRHLNCPLTVIDGTNSATFKPDEPGEWRIEITYQGKQIQVGLIKNYSVKDLIDFVFLLVLFLGWTLYLLSFRSQWSPCIWSGRSVTFSSSQHRHRHKSCRRSW